GHAQLAAHAVIRLHQHAHRVAVAGVELGDARRGAGAALEVVAGHAGAAADVAFGDRATGCAFDRVVDVLRGDVEAVDVVEFAIPGFRHHRQRPPVARGIGLALAHAPGDGGVAHHADAVRVGQQHRTLEEAG